MLIMRNGPPPDVGPPPSGAYGWMTLRRRTDRPQTAGAGPRAHAGTLSTDRVSASMCTQALGEDPMPTLLRRSSRSSK
eukprot:scaffold13838_cov67-Phaeocystis_antarctica.AAC.2